MISISCIAAGSILFACSSMEGAPLFLPAMCLIAFGGPGAQNAIIHLSNLFPTKKATVTAIITGSFQISFFIFFCFDYLWANNKYDYQTLFMGYSFVLIFNIFLSFLLWPDKPYNFDDELLSVASMKMQGAKAPPSPIDERRKLGKIRLPSVMMNLADDAAFDEIEDATGSSSNLISDATKKASDNSMISTTSETKKLSSPSRKRRLKERNMKDQLMSFEYVWITLYFVINSYWTNFYVGTIDLQLGDSTLYTSTEQRNLGRLFTIVISCGIFAIPIIGLLMDKLGFPITSLVTTFLGITWSLLMLTEVKEVTIAVFIFYGLFRTFLFTFLFAYIADVFGFKYFGILAGIMFIIGGFVGLTQYPLMLHLVGDCHFYESKFPKSCYRGSWHYINILMLVSQLFLLCFTYNDWKRRRAAQGLLFRVRSYQKVSSVELNSINTDSKKLYGATNL